MGDSNDKANSITSNQIMVISMMQNLSHMYYRVSSSYCDAFLCMVDSNNKANLITSSQIMVISMMQNLSHMYYRI